MTPDDQGASFPGDDRFERVAELGRGGMGVVYEVRDRDRQVPLALKCLRKVGPREILRLKNEFRALRDLRHPNLVQLGDLFEDDGRWFFTMELVHGVDFMKRVRIASAERTPAPVWVPPASESETTDTRADARGPAPHTAVIAAGTPAPERAVLGPERGAPVARAIAIPPREPATAWGFDEARLRAALRGLITGLAALHRAGMVHRDVKPSNILVEPEGRVVLLDFGVAVGFETSTRDTPPRGTRKEIVGTFAYMAPEQVAAAAVGPAADWYAVGVVLFQALTGVVPFSGIDGMYAKQKIDAPSPRAWVADLPDDLVGLCERLLARDPADRPTEAELLARFGIRPEHVVDSDGSGPGGAGVFVGRAPELAALDEAFEEVATERRARAVIITGESGIGKSALVRRFLDRLDERRPDVLVLSSRCDEREIVPFNALDGAVDGLARFLSAVPSEITSPIGARELLRTFPVLSTVGALARAARRSPTLGNVDPRQMAFAALSELLATVAQVRHVVLFVDDIHWADVDSLGALGDVLGPAEAPPLLLVATAREAADAPCPAIEALRRPVTVLRLGGLAPDDAEALLRAASPVARSGVDTAQLAAEAAGHPLFLAELARGLDRHGDGAARLDDALWQRITALDDRARDLVEVVALAAGALPLGTVAAAVTEDATAFARALGVARGARLVRVTGTRDLDRIEPYHDRVRETVAARLPSPRRRAVHLTLAMVVEARHGAVEVVAYHLLHGGEHARAAVLAEIAAQRAADAMAFERAAEWLRIALDTHMVPAARRRDLLAQRADLLARAGRTVAAADTFRAAAAEPGQDPDVALELQRRAVEELLIGGHTAQGLALGEHLMVALGLQLPTTTVGQIARVGWYQARTTLSRLRWRLRPVEAIPERARLRVDLAWSIATGLSMTDSMRGVVMATRLPLLALPTGDATRIAQATCAACMAWSAMGRRRLALRLQEAAHRAADATDDLSASQYATFADVVVDFYLTNDWPAVLAGAGRAAGMGGDGRRGHTFSDDIIEQHHLMALALIGSYDELRRRVRPAVRAAERVGNRYIEVSLRTFFPAIHLIEDRPAEAFADVIDAVQSWQVDVTLTTPFYFALKGRTQIALYREDLDGALDPTLDRDWDRLRSSLLDQLPIIRADSAQYRAMLEIARTAAARARRDDVGVTHHGRLAARFIQRLVNVKMPTCVALGALLRVCLQAARGDLEGATAAAPAVIELLERWHWRAAAAGLRWRLGGPHRARAVQFFAEEGVERPERMVDAITPGWPAEPMLGP